MSLTQKTYENSILQLGVLRKIEEIASASAQETILVKDEIIRQNTLVTGVSNLLKEQNKVLLSIRDEIRQQKEVDQKKTDVLSGTPMKKLLMAAGVVAVMALGLYAFGEVFKGLESVSMTAILNGIAIALAMIPITKAFSMIVQELPTSLLRGPKLMFNAVLSLAVMTSGFAMMAIAMLAAPIVSGEKLMSALAVAGVTFVLGLTFAKLMESLTTHGFMEARLNKNRTNEAMQTMVLMAFAMVAIGLALRIAPKVNPQQAAAFVIIGFTLMPMAVALVALKFAFIMSRKIKTNDVLKTTGFLAILSMALIPISIAAALVPKLSPGVAKNIRSLAPILIPLSVVAAIIAAVINKRSQKKMMGSLFPADQAPEPEGKKGMDPKKIAMVVGGLIAAAVGMIGVAWVISKSGGVLTAASNVIANLNYGGLFMMLFLVSVAALMVALVVNVMRGKGASSMTTGVKGVFGGQQTQKQGKITTNDMIVGAATIPVVALGILAAAWVFQGLPGTFVSPDTMWTLKAGLSIFLFGMAIAKISNATKKLETDDLIKGTVVSLAVALLITAVAHLFSAYPGDPSLMPSLKFIAMAAATILIFAIPFALITLAVKRLSGKDLIKGVVASAIVSMALVGVAFVFAYLSSVGSFVAPPVDWSLKAGLAILVFGGAYALVSLLTSKLGIKTMLQGIIGVAVIALAILAVGWIFNMLNGVGFTAPPISWSLAVALSLVAFTIPALVIGLIATSGIGAVGLLLGVVGMIVIAAGIWVVAWIFSKLPDLTSVSKMLTEALLTPVNGIVDVLKRLKEEIGVENLLPLAGGIIAISGSLLILAAASAGAAAAGLGASLMNAGKAFVDFISGEDTKGPLDILQEIIDMGPKITKLSKPIESIGRAIGFLMGGPDMEQMTNFLVAISTSSMAVAAHGKSLENIFMSMSSSSAAIASIGKDGAETIRAFGVLEGVSRSTIDSATDFIKKLGKTSLDSQATAMEKIAKSYNTISRSSNTINIEAINATTDMFKALAYLYQNGKKNAIEELGDKLIEAVQELAKMIADFGGTVNEQSVGNAEASSTISSALDGIKSIISGSAGNYNSSGGSSPSDSSNDALNSIQELIDLLQSGQAKITITDLDPAAEAKLA